MRKKQENLVCGFVYLSLRDITVIQCNAQGSRKSRARQFLKICFRFWLVLVFGQFSIGKVNPKHNLTGAIFPVKNGRTIKTAFYKYVAAQRTALSPSKMPLFNVQRLQQKHLIKATSLDEFAEKVHVAAKFQIGSEEVPKYYSTDGAQVTDFEVFEGLSENSKTGYPTIIVKLDSECKSTTSSQSKSPCIMTKAAAMNYEVPVNRIKAHHALHDALTSKKRSDVTNALTSQLIRIITEDLLERYGYDETDSKARDVIATALIQKYPNLKLNECDTGGVLKIKLGRRVSYGLGKWRLRDSINWHQIMEGDHDLEMVREKLAKMIIENSGTDGQKSEMAKNLIPLIDRDIQIYWVQGKLPGGSDSDPVVTAEIIYQRYPHLKKAKFLFEYYKEKTGKDAKEFVEGEIGYFRLLKTYKYLNHYAKSDRGRDNKSLKYHKDLLNAWCGDLYDTSKYETEKAQQLMVTLAFLSAYFGENLEGMIAAYNTLNSEDIPHEPKIPVRGVCLVLVGEKSGCPSAIYVSVHRICTVKCSRVEDGFAAFFATHYLWGIDYFEDSAFTMTYFQKFLCELTPAPLQGLPEVATDSGGIKKGRKKIPKTHKVVNITKMDRLMAKVGEYRIQDEKGSAQNFDFRSDAHETFDEMEPVCSNESCADSDYRKNMGSMTRPVLLPRGHATAEEALIDIKSRSNNKESPSYHHKAPSPMAGDSKFFAEKTKDVGKKSVPDASIIAGTKTRPKFRSMYQLIPLSANGISLSIGKLRIRLMPECERSLKATKAYQSSKCTAESNPSTADSYQNSVKTGSGNSMLYPHDQNLAEPSCSSYCSSIKASFPPKTASLQPSAAKAPGHSYSDYDIREYSWICYFCQKKFRSYISLHYHTLEHIDKEQWTSVSWQTLVQKTLIPKINGNQIIPEMSEKTSITSAKKLHQSVSPRLPQPEEGTIFSKSSDCQDNLKLLDLQSSDVLESTIQGISSEQSTEGYIICGEVKQEPFDESFDPYNGILPNISLGMKGDHLQAGGDRPLLAQNTSLVEGTLDLKPILSVGVNLMSSLNVKQKTAQIESPILESGCHSNSVKPKLKSCKVILQRMRQKEFPPNICSLDDTPWNSKSPILAESKVATNHLTFRRQQTELQLLHAAQRTLLKQKSAKIKFRRIYEYRQRPKENQKLVVGRASTTTKKGKYNEKCKLCSYRVKRTPKKDLITTLETHSMYHMPALLKCPMMECSYISNHWQTLKLHAIRAHDTTISANELPNLLSPRMYKLALRKQMELCFVTFEEKGENKPGEFSQKGFFSLIDCIGESVSRSISDFKLPNDFSI